MGELPDAWWRVPWAPTPEEWAALWGLGAMTVAAIAGVIAIFALTVARGQLRAAVESNRELAKSNQTLEASNREIFRPRLSLDLVPGRLEAQDYRQSRIVRLEVVISNVGASTARKVMFSARPMPTNMAMSPGLRSLLDSTSTIPTISPGASIRHVLDVVPRDRREFTEEQLETNFTVKVTYAGSDDHHYADSIEIDLRPLKNALYGPDGLARISKDIQGLTSAVGRLKLEVERPRSPRRGALIRERRRRPYLE